MVKLMKSRRGLKIIHVEREKRIAELEMDVDELICVEFGNFPASFLYYCS